MKRGKKFLERANNIESKIDATLRKVELYKSLTQRVSAKLNRDRVSQSSDVTANEKAIIRLMDEEERLKQLYDEYEKIVDEITAVLTKLEDPNDERLLVAVSYTHLVKPCPIQNSQWLCRINLVQLFGVTSLQLRRP